MCNVVGLIILLNAIIVGNRLIGISSFIRCLVVCHLLTIKLDASLKTWSDVVIKSFMKCHITNSMDGIEDEFHLDPDIGSNDKMSDTFQSDNESNEDFVGFEPN